MRELQINKRRKLQKKQLCKPKAPPRSFNVLFVPAAIGLNSIPLTFFEGSILKPDVFEVLRRTETESLATQSILGGIRLTIRIFPVSG